MSFLPANLTPQYKAAEERYRRAQGREEKIAALEEMLAVIPKHKGTEHLQGDLRKRLAKLRKAAETKAGARTADPFQIPVEGAGQVVFLGYPNTGKSALVGVLTRAPVTVADYPFATQLPVVGMMNYEDIKIQLVDLPPVMEGELPKGMAGTLRQADLIGLVVDGGSDDCLEQLEGCREILYQRSILAPPGEEPGPQTKTADDVLVLIAKADLPGAGDRLELLREFSPGWEMLAVSIKQPESLERLRGCLFRRLRIIRIYTKIPGRAPDKAKPFILKEGETVLELAAQVHRDFPGRLKQAKVWGSTKFPGQSVEKNYPLADGDIVELHV